MRSDNAAAAERVAKVLSSRELRSHHRRQPEATKQFCRVGVGGVKRVLLALLVVVGHSSGSGGCSSQLQLLSHSQLRVVIVAVISSLICLLIQYYFKLLYALLSCLFILVDMVLLRVRSTANSRTQRPTIIIAN